MMTRKITLTLVVLILFIPVFTYAGDDPSGKPFQALQKQIDQLQQQINNIQLIPGPQGLAGPAGPQGEPGPSGLSSLQYRWTRCELQFPHTPPTNVCPSVCTPTEIVVTGGYSIISYPLVDGLQPQVISNHPQDDTRTWATGIFFPAPGEVVVDVLAVCAPR